MTNTWAFLLHPGIDDGLQRRYTISANGAIKGLEPVHVSILSFKPRGDVLFPTPHAKQSFSLCRWLLYILRKKSAIGYGTRYDLLPDTLPDTSTRDIIHVVLSLVGIKYGHLPLRRYRKQFLITFLYISPRLCHAGPYICTLHGYTKTLHFYYNVVP